MRRNVRLTGRKQIPKSSIRVDSTFLEEKGVLGLIIQDERYFASFPHDARVRLRLTENKFSETMDFGTIGERKNAEVLRNRSFSFPSCEVRIVSQQVGSQGKLLGSSAPWTLTLDDDPQGDQSRTGILLFLPKDIAPQIWKLDIRETEHPVVYVDKQIPNYAAWVRTDPVFVGAVLPSVIKEVFGRILESDENRDNPWMRDWLAWAEELVPGATPPFEEEEEKETVGQWIDSVADSFCAKHYLHSRLTSKLSGGE